MTSTELRALIAGATKGEWSSGFDDSALCVGDSQVARVYWHNHGNKSANASLIVALVNNAERFAELLAAEEAQWVDVCIIEPTVPFIANVSAGWGKPALDSIEEELVDGDWENLPGVPPEAVSVRCEAHHCPAQIGDEGHIELPAYWDLTPIGYEVMDGEGVSTYAAVEAAVRAGR